MAMPIYCPYCGKSNEKERGHAVVEPIGIFGDGCIEYRCNNCEAIYQMKKVREGLNHDRRNE